MTVAGFSFIRNAITYDYPIVEALRSILPICDYVVVAVGKSDDATLELVRQIAPEKIRIVETVWDDSLRDGAVLADETNKAFDAIGDDADWCIYIQGDEVLPEWEHEKVKNALEMWQKDANTEGVLLKYRHFYGSFDYVATSRNWYRNEIRIIKNDKKIRSYKDAQGFRKNDNKLKVRALDAYIHHYGWVRNPQAQQRKQVNMNKYWFTEDFVREKIDTVDTFDYGDIHSLARYELPHPVVMQPRIKAQNWQFSFDPTRRKPPLKERFSLFIEKLTGRRIGEYRNYERID